MNVALEEFGLRLKSGWLTTSHRCFRPPSWPPPSDWVVSEDSKGEVLSYWSQPTWDLSPWAGKTLILDFGDGLETRKAERIDPANAHLMRLLATWFMWGPRAASKTNTLKARFLPVRRIVALCSRNGILASELMRFPKVLEQLSSVISSSEYQSTILELHRLWDAREQLGFVLVDDDGIKRLTLENPSHETKQTAYIPPRIWTYQLQRVRACLDDFLAHSQQVEDCFNFCIDAYAFNFGSLGAAVNKRSQPHLLPFKDPPKPGSGIRSGARYYGRFDVTAKRFGIDELVKRWVSIPALGMDVRQLSSYLTLVQCAGMAHIANFTLQRIDEVGSLRTDCLLWEEDESLGRIPIICGETTKTDPDSDARWPTCPSVEVAVTAMSTVARLRMRCVAAVDNFGASSKDQMGIYLIDRACEPWLGNVTRATYKRIHLSSYLSIIRRYPKLFENEQLRILEKDLILARMLTPNLSQEKGFSVGKVWPFTWHQLRRTGAVNMFASGLLSDSSIQFQMKHASRLMPLYYGRGYTKLHLNEEAEGVIVATMYEAIAHNLQSALGDRFVSPLGNERKQTILVNLVGNKDAKALIAAARRGQVIFRETRLGACTKRGACSYGGVESVSRCSGGDGGGPCADALYDRTKAFEMERERAQVEHEIAGEVSGSPRYKSLLAELNGLENFLNVVRS